MDEDFIDAFRDTGSSAKSVQCSSCGRTFNPTIIERHENICTKQKKRKPFDSARQRTGDLPKDVLKTPTKSHSELTASAKKSKWRQKHEEFVANIRAARKITAAQKAGEPLPPPPPAAVNPDYVQCPHCSRRFNEHAAERHIPFCKEQKSRLGNTSSAKSSTLAKRNQYKPPLPGKKTTTGSATPLSLSSAKSRQASSKARPEQTSPSARAGGTPVHKDRRQPVASPTTRRKLPQSSSPLSTKHRNREFSATTGTNPIKTRSSERQTTEFFGSDEESSPWTQTREAKYGRRSSQSNGNLNDQKEGSMESGTFGYSDKTDRFSSSASHHRRRQIAVIDPSPTEDHSPFSVRERSHKTPPLHSSKWQRDGSATKRLSKFCHECGTKYPVESAKFCCECGIKRLYIDVT